MGVKKGVKGIIIEIGNKQVIEIDGKDDVMRNSLQVMITYDKGIHTRVAAMIVKRCQELNDKYNCQLYIQRHHDNSILPGNSMLALVSMRIRKGEVISVFSEDKNSMKAVEAFADFLSGSFTIDAGEMDEVDHIIQSNMLASEKVFQSIANGLIVTDHNNIINVFNRAAEKITGISAKEAVGKNANYVIKNLGLHQVLKTGKEQLGLKQTIGNNVIITNLTPIIVEGKVVGVVAVFQDISEIETLSWELNSVKELKEKFKNILESVDDGICMIDKEKIITYMNRPFEEMMEKEGCNILGKSVFEIFPKATIKKVIHDKTARFGDIIKREDGSEIIFSINPVVIDGDMKGAMVVTRELTEIQRLAEQVEELSAKTLYLQEQLIKKQQINESFHIITGKSGPLMDALSVASKASETDATVLIRGESGTGKELVAKAIHYASPRRNKPLVRVNCAAIPSNLLESELFGYEKGAFTGAFKQKLGKFELANEGTIFLDEIGDMDKSMQAKLLRVLQEKEIERVGGLRTIKINVRVIAATNSPLEQLMETGEFRKDLYYRLNVIPVMLPPLRQRQGDIPLLAEHFIEKISNKYNFTKKKIMKDALKCLQEYAWPGNVRELENIIERAMTLSHGDWITIQDLPTYIGEAKAFKELLTPTVFITGEDDLPTMEEVEKAIIAKALEKHKSFRKAGVALGLNHKTIASKARKYNLL